MNSLIRTVDAAAFAQLPPSLHYTGEPTPWTKITRPGMRLHSFLEGLVILSDGSFLLADVPHGRILRVTADGTTWSEAFKYDGEPHGLAVRDDGRIIVADYRRGLLLVDLQAGKFQSLCNGFNTENFKGLSDLVLDREGNVWFTDSGRSSLSDPSGRLFCLSPAGALRCVLDSIPYPNGVAVSHDGAHLFLAVTRDNAVWKLARKLPEHGKPMSGRYLPMSGGLGPDGLASSDQGYLAVAHAQAGRAWVFNDIGDPLARVSTPGGLWTTSVRFSSDGGTLFIVDAQSGSIFKHELDY